MPISLDRIAWHVFLFLPCHTKRCVRAMEGGKGLHSGKELPTPKPPMNISEVLSLTSIAVGVVLSHSWKPSVRNACNLVPVRLEAYGKSTRSSRICCRWIAVQVSFFFAQLLQVSNKLRYRVFPQNSLTQRQPDTYARSWR